MRRRVLGRTGLEVSEIGFGGVEIGLEYGIQVDGVANRPPREQAVRLVQQAVELGVNAIDTARAYGASESIIGEAIAGRRDAVVLMSKLAAIDPALSGAELASFVESSLVESLRELRTDAIDVMQLHSVSIEVLRRGEVMDLLSRHQEAGKVRFLGATIYTEEEARLALADDRIDVIQVPFSMLDPSMADDVLPRAAQQEVAVVARSVLHRGVLTPKGRTGSDDERRLHAAATAMEFLRDEHAEELPHVATRFVLSHPEISCALLGMDNTDQLQQNVAFSGAPPYSTEQRARVYANRPDNPWVILPADTTGNRQK